MVVKKGIVKKGDKVKVEYKGTLDDGTVFDSSEGKEPIAFEAGSGQVIKGFDNAVIDMKNGEEKKINIKSTEAYGDVNPALVKKVPKAALQGQEPKPGMMLLLQAPDGRKFPARITEVTDKEITIDLNHPLAGKNLNFDIKVVEISS
jgi:FKBP-type peptidyl-prolyl cis-trans isomerase 2